MFGKETVRKSNERVKNMSKKGFNDMAKVENELMDTLQAATQIVDTEGQLAKRTQNFIVNGLVRMCM